MPFYTKHLRDGEQIIEVIRKHWTTNIFKYIILIILICLPFFFMVPLFNAGMWGQIIFAFLLAVALFWLLKIISLNYFNCLVITTQRLINFSQAANFTRQVKEVDFVDITEVSYAIKGLQHLTKTGSIFIKTKASQNKTAIKIEQLKQPQDVQRLILDLKKLAIEEDLLKHKQAQTQENYSEILQRMKQNIGQSGIERLMRNLEQKEDEE